MKSLITTLAEMPILRILLGAILVTAGALGDGGETPILSSAAHFLEVLGTAIILLQLFLLFKKG